MGEFVGALDQGTTSTRFIIFDHDGREVARDQVELPQILPRAGWVEHDPVTIAAHAREVIAGALARAGLAPADLAAIGLTNQRETTVVWDRQTGRPFLNAVVWQDMRSDRLVAELERSGAGELVRERTGLPPATYFSAGKLRWALDNVPEVRAAAERGTALFGTVDTWLTWNLTGGPQGGSHITDVTNASRTLLMDLRRLEWSPDMLGLWCVPETMLPTIVASTGSFGQIRIDGRQTAAGASTVPLAAMLGDQQAAMVGQVCLSAGEAKNTYGTGNFLLANTGPDIVRSGHGLLSTVCFQMAGETPRYALEGSVAVTGAAVQWLRDQLGLIADASETEALAAQVTDSAGAYFVPAFSGLFAPYWRADARGAIVGLTRATTRAHLARATLEAVCFQTRDVLLAMEKDLGARFTSLKVDGGITANRLCMQLQADIAGIAVSKPEVAETTALGAAYAAGCAVGFWSGPGELRRNWREAERWEPRWSEDQRDTAYAGWQKAVERSLGWADAGDAH